MIIPRLLTSVIEKTIYRPHISGRIRLWHLPPTNAVRRAQASAESPFSIRSCINILREVENGDRKTNSNKKGENRLRNRRRFSTLDCVWLCGESAQIEKIQRIIDPIRFPICAASARRLTSRSRRISSGARILPSRWLPPWRTDPALFRGRTAPDERTALRSR